MSNWAPFVTKRLGPLWKVGYSFAGQSGPKRGDVKHSAEGYWPGIYSVLDGPVAVSWHFTVGYDRTEQHYPITAHCYHAGDADDDGGVAANIDLVGIEHIGKNDILTPYQQEMTARITKFCADRFGIRGFARYPIQQNVWTLVEHNEVSDAPTSCPSGRIPWGAIIRRLTEENGGEDMPDEVARQQLVDLKLVVQTQGQEIETLQGVVADVKRVVSGQGDSVEVLRGIVADVKKRVEAVDVELATHQALRADNAHQ